MKKTPYYNTVKPGQKVKFTGISKNGFISGNTYEVDHVKSDSAFTKTVVLKNGNKKLIVKGTNSIQPISESMKISKNRIKEIVRETIVEENEYQDFFQKCLAKAGKSIPNMGTQEKKDFFNKIDSAWNSKGEKRGITKEKVLPQKSSPVFEKKINEYNKKDGIQVEKSTFTNGTEGYGGFVKLGKYTKVIPVIPGATEKKVRVRANKLYTAMKKWVKEDERKEKAKEKKKKVNESNPVKGKKSFYTQDRVGSSKYTINPYDGKATHKDGSPFYGILPFKNKKKYEAKKKELKKQGYIEESINEAGLAGEWVVYIGKSYDPKVHKVVKSHRAAQMMMKKLIATDKYDAVGTSHYETFKKENPQLKLESVKEAKNVDWSTPEDRQKLVNKYYEKFKTIDIAWDKLRKDSIYKKMGHFDKIKTGRIWDNQIRQDYY